ncbi:MAG: phosphoglucosamine mutase [bacterium]
MEQKRKLNASGYRGIWGKDLDQQISFEYARAYAKMIKSNGGKKILIGRDTRKTGPLIFQAVKNAFEKEGMETEYAGILPTPSMVYLTKKLSFDGGFMITASHNPIEYNGLKPIMGTGLLTNEKEAAEIQKMREELTPEEKIFIPEEKDIEVVFDNYKYRRLHIEEVLKHIDVELIKSKKFKIAHDPINATGSLITKELFQELGCEVFVVNEEMTGEFAHMPEPNPENLKGLSELATKNKVNIGFAQDPDADRLVVVSEKGKVLFEEYSIVLAIKSVLSKTSNKNGQNIVLNMSTSRMGRDVAESYGAKMNFAKVGEPNVVDLIKSTNAILGGEGNGGIIFPTINFCRDTLVGIGLVLELIARENKPISEIIESFPKYFMKKEKYPAPEDLQPAYKKIKTMFPEAESTEVDGICLSWPDSSWVHVHPSNTEPIVRIYGEAKTQERIDSLFDQVRLTLNA